MGRKPGAHRGQVCILVWLLWGAGKDEVNQSMHSWACLAKMYRFYPWAREGIGAIQDAFLKDPCSVRESDLFRRRDWGQRDQTYQDGTLQFTSLIFTKKHPSGLECSVHSLPARKSWQTELGLFDAYEINAESLHCFDLFMLFKNLFLIMQVRFEYILVIKNSNDINQVKDAFDRALAFPHSSPKVSVLSVWDIPFIPYLLSFRRA